MVLRNFGPYKGEQTVNFTDEAGVSIFWGNNGRGKTTLLNAFRYGLFGVVQRRNGLLQNLSEMENSEAVSEGHHGFSVAIEMSNEGDTYELSRQLALRQNVTSPSGEEDYEKILFLKKNGSILSPEDRDHELNMIMPESVSRFFLFDAELLQEYEELLEVDTADGEQIKNAIEKILGVPVIQNGVIDIEDCLSKYDQQKARAARSDDKTVQLGNTMETLNANIEEHQNIIQEKQADLSELVSKRNILENKMKETDKLREWIIKRNEADKRKSEAEDELGEVMGEIRVYLRNAWKGMLLTTINNTRNNVEKEKKQLESKKQKRNVAEHFIIEMKKAVAEKKCPICEQDVNSDIITKLQERINESTSEYTGLSENERERLYQLQECYTNINELVANITDVKSDIAILEERRDRLQIQISEWKQEIEELKDNIERYGSETEESDVFRISKEHSRVEQDITETKKGIEKENDALKVLKEDKEQISKTIDRMAGGTDYRIASKRYDLCEHVFNIFDESKTKYRERLKKNVEKDATELFVQITGDKDYVGLRINDNYGLEIIHKSGRIVPGRSSGYEHIVALALIGALHKNAPLRGPIIMDSPFGRLDPIHKANIVRALPYMAEQSMLLAYTGEIDEQLARKELGSHLLREYKLERISSMHTEIK